MRSLLSLSRERKTSRDNKVYNIKLVLPDPAINNLPRQGKVSIISPKEWLSDNSLVLYSRSLSCLPLGAVPLSRP